MVRVRGHIAPHWKSSATAHVAIREMEPWLRSMGVTKPSTCAALRNQSPADDVTASPSSVCDSRERSEMD